MKPKLSILGAGGQGKVVADAARRQGSWCEIDFFDDNVPSGSEVDGHRVSGSLEDLLSASNSTNHQVIIGLGDNHKRLNLHKQLLLSGWTLAKVVHPWSEISANSYIGVGTAVMAGVIVNTGSLVGQACILNTRCSVDHDCNIADGVHISPGAVLAGHVTVGLRATVGVGATVSNGIMLGCETTLGAGAVSIRNVPDSEVHVGCPAVKLR